MGRQLAISLIIAQADITKKYENGTLMTRFQKNYAGVKCPGI